RGHRRDHRGDEDGGVDHRATGRPGATDRDQLRATGRGRRPGAGADHRRMTRVVGGTWGGRRLVTPAGETTRPTAEKVRAALAGSLYATGGLDGARVLDLYAGSGALRLELVSKGAASAVFVEHDRAALTALRANIAALGASTAQLIVIPGDVA